MTNDNNGDDDGDDNNLARGAVGTKQQ
jgi:hypothetical protein